MQDTTDILDPRIFDAILEHASRLSFDQIDVLECDEDVRAVIRAARIEVERRWELQVLTEELVLIEDMKRVGLDAGSREDRIIFEKMQKKSPPSR